MLYCCEAECKAWLKLQLYTHRHHDVLLQAIKPPTGVAYIAAKTYYFGVGGGTTSFKKMLKSDGMLEVSTVATIDEGGGNKREILKLKFPDNIIPYFL